MKSRRPVILTAIVAIIAFGVAAYVFTQNQSETEPQMAEDMVLIRPHSPAIGPTDARVTIVEFFDPSCETCRAFYPLVKNILDENPETVRLVIRYAAFHEGSDEVVRILEAARRQDLYLEVMEALLARQPEWAVHGAPNLDLAWSIASAAGLDVARGRVEAASVEVANVLREDAADVFAANIQATPTFFVNGEPLPAFGPAELVTMVAEKLRETE